MTEKLFPRTMVGGVSMPRMLIGSNWMVGYSHRSVSADDMIKARYDTSHKVSAVVEAFLAHGIDATMGMMEDCPIYLQGVRMAEERTGKKVIFVDTPIINVDDNEAARLQARRTIKKSKELGATFCLLHHSCCEQLVNKNTRTIDRLPDYLDMIRQEGLIPGLSAHMPEMVVYSDMNEYDVETYIQLYNCMGFLMQVEIEYIHNVIMNAKKPVMTIKSMAAGRVTPFVGLSFSYATLRECDMVTVGCFNENEVYEDVEIAYAVLERRAPNLKGRSSPKKTEIMQDR